MAQVSETLHDFQSTKDIDVPDKLIDQVIGQDRAVEVIRKAAKQHRHVMMIGKPGTGKSMLAKSMTELMDTKDLQDIVVFPNGDDKNNPIIKEYDAGRGEKVVEEHKEANKRRENIRRKGVLLLILGILGLSIYQGEILFGIVGGIIVYIAYSLFIQESEEEKSPKVLVDNSDRDIPPFEDATGAQKGAILGDVRHDPYQSGNMETPPHQRVEAGLIHKANEGVLFIDEINTLGVEEQQKLMTAIQEKEFAITGQSENSSGAMVKTEAAPTNFVLVAAGNMDAIENIHPAIRDRIEGDGYEVYMEEKMDDTKENRNKIARFVSQEVHRDGSIPHFNRGAIEEIIQEARRKAQEKNKLTLRLRNLGGLVRVAGDIAVEENADMVERRHVQEARELDRSIEQQVTDLQIEQKKKYNQKQNSGETIGRVNGLAVMGDDSGIMLPVMARISDSQSNDGEVIATGKLEEIAEESVQNVSSIIKDIGKDALSGKDVHVQFVQTYEGVDGDSASITVATGIISALENIPVKQNIAMTGSLSIRGDVLPVGGVTHKIEAAAKAGMDTVIIPAANEDDIVIKDKYRDQIDIVKAETLTDVLEVALVNTEKTDEILDKIRSV